jgi:hypothetical protein
VLHLISPVCKTVSQQKLQNCGLKRKSPSFPSCSSWHSNFDYVHYGFEGRLVYVREAGPVIIPSATGVRQGDALSMPFFALGSAPVLRETASMVPEVFPAAVADDCTLL